MKAKIRKTSSKLTIGSICTHAIMLFSLVFGLSLCSCASNASNITSNIVEDIDNESLLVLDTRVKFTAQELSAKEQKLYTDITEAFFEQIIKGDNVKDDSSFCGYYELRQITIDSIKPFLDFGTFQDAYILTFIINGFYYDINDFDILLNDEKTAFTFDKEKDEQFSPYLMPFVYEKGNICSIKDAFQNNIVDLTYFEHVSMSHYTIPNKGRNALLSDIGANYFNHLPSLADGRTTSYSPLKSSFEETKNLFYQQEIVGNGYLDDRPYRTLFKEPRYKQYYIDVDYSSIHLNFYKDCASGMKLFIISINDILNDIQSWFGDGIDHEIILGNDVLHSNFVIEPLVQINQNIYYLTDAYNLGVLTDAMLLDIKEAYPSSIMDDWSPKGFAHLETKLLERRYLLNEIHRLEEDL